jgi:hypothetical protein
MAIFLIKKKMMATMATIEIEKVGVTSTHTDIFILS